MAAATPGSPLALFTWSWIFALASGDLIEITSKSGVIVTLPCQASNSTTITAVEWIRPDLEPEYVAKYQDGQFDLNNQHLSFKDRVELEDSEMKDGDVSLVLRDVTTDDRGTYECHITLRRTNDTVKETVETETFTIKLNVLPHPINITSNSGHTVILPCRVPSSRNITTVKWMRTDLWFENVLKYQDGQYDLNDQHLSFKDRVELEDSEMKDGDMSLVLRNVTPGDSGIYACVLIQERITDTELISFINLNVKPVPEFIRAEPGDNVTLACRAPSYTDIRTVVWSRPDLEPRVILYQKRMSDPVHQHLSFQDRVELEDNEMKDGDVSLVLRNVTTGDSGTYECRVIPDTIFYIIADHEPFCIVHLNSNPEPKLPVLRPIVSVVVWTPYFISTLLMVSLYRERLTGRKAAVTMTMPPPSEEGLDGQHDDVYDNVTTEHQF